MSACRRISPSWKIAGLAGALAALTACAKPRPVSAPTRPAPPPWADFVEPDFPFFDSIVDARQAGPAWPKDNVTPRGIVLNLGHGQWACFDTELLRISAAWTGGAVTPASMAQASYQLWSGKSRQGEDALPRPAGPVWWATGRYPGWQQGTEPRLADPRTPAPSPQEAGRGPLPVEQGRFQSLELAGGGLQLHYSAFRADVVERWSGSGDRSEPALTRRVTIGPSATALWLVAGVGAHAVLECDEPGVARLAEFAGVRCVAIAVHRKPLTLTLRLSLRAGAAPADSRESPRFPADDPGPLRWPQVMTTRGSRSPRHDPYVVDDIALPLGNPWRRNVRPADIQFLPDGRAAVLTFDGDVWLVDGLSGDLSRIRWKRFASGFNECLSLAVRDGVIYVFDRNGIWQLRDRRHRDEADEYVLFSNAFAQSADGREFPNGIRLAPDRSFVIAKGGEQADVLGKLNGTVLRVAPDGRSYVVLGWGFRQPFIGVNARTGEVTASDQEGNYVPATPLYEVEGNAYHGYLAPVLPPERYPAPIAEPLTWIPHNVSPSAVTQVWADDPRFGPLAGSLLLVSYNYPELFQVLRDRQGPKAQAAVTSLTRDFRFPPLSGATDPADGQLYLAGFRIYGTAADKIAGLARVRFSGGPADVLRECVPTGGGILLGFAAPVDPASLHPADFAVERWNYRRTPGYGSFDYRADGSVGEDRLEVVGLRVSEDHRTCFVDVAGMSASGMQMHLGWRCRGSDGRELHGDLYFTPRVIGPVPEWVGRLRRVQQGPVAPSAPTLASQGRQLYLALGCMSCHSDDGAARIGPTWKGLFGSTVALTSGGTVVADDAYVRRHLGRHPREIVRGFPNAMPDYARLVSPAQAEALIAYLRTLQ